MFVRIDADPDPRWDEASDKRANATASRARVRQPEARLEMCSLHLLIAAHRTTSTELGVLKAVDEVRGTHQEIHIEWPVLPVLERSKSIEHQALTKRDTSPSAFLEEQAVSPQTLHLARHRRVRGSHFEGDLTES